ncbi:MAG TPA: hypothetical protein VLH35_08570 [Candidatus Acidoferrales bacterium]|nr:hypothetical protein [Candidatus Acidoferrales bacterium]
MGLKHHLAFLIAITILIVALILSIVVYGRILRVNFFVANLRFSHWLGIAGTIGVAIATPLFTILKHKYPLNWTKITRFHIFGNLLFFTLILFHFSTQIARPSTAFPELGSGLAMMIAMILQIALGFTQRFRSRQTFFKKFFKQETNRFLHASLVMVFYLVIVLHVLHGLGLT